MQSMSGPTLGEPLPRNAHKRGLTAPASAESTGFVVKRLGGMAKDRTVSVDIDAGSQIPCRNLTIDVGSFSDPTQS
jgi:hypothetical protein